MASLTQWTWVWETHEYGEGQRSLAGFSSWCRKESDTTEWLNCTELNYEETLVVWEKNKFMKHKLIYSHSFIKLIFGKQSSGVSDGLTKDHKVIEIANCSQVLERVHLMPPGAAQRDLRSIQTERVAGLGPMPLLWSAGRVFWSSLVKARLVN